MYRELCRNHQYVPLALRLDPGLEIRRGEGLVNVKHRHDKAFGLNAGTSTGAHQFQRGEGHLDEEACAGKSQELSMAAGITCGMSSQEGAPDTRRSVEKKLT